MPDREGVLTVLTCGLTDFDSRLALYRRANSPLCDFLEGVACNDDAPFCDFGSIMSVPIHPDDDFKIPRRYAVQPGDELLIRVGSRDPAISGSGSFVVTVVPNQPPPSREEPYDCGLFIGNFLGGFFVGSQDLSFFNGIIDDTPSCGDLDVQDLWMCFVSPWTSVVEVSGSFSSAKDFGSPLTIAVYDVYGTVLTCDLFESTNFFNSFQTFWPAVNGQSYLVRFATVLDGNLAFSAEAVSRLRGKQRPCTGRELRRFSAPRKHDVERPKYSERSLRRFLS